MTTTTSTYTHDTVFKVLDGNTSTHGGHATWTPGEWMPKIDNIIPCERGYHLCVGPQHLMGWLGPTIWTAEYRGDAVTHNDDKVVVAEARILFEVETWNERTARLFACDCVEHVLHLFENEWPNDHRPRQAIDVARRYANGNATDDDLAAARDAARDAAWEAVREAARAAAREAAWEAAREVAWRAAWAAAREVAWAAAREAARDAEREWQAERLLAYLNGQAT